MALFQFNPRVQAIVEALPGVRHQLADEAAPWVEMWHRRDIDLEDYLAHLAAGINVPPGVAAGDLYDDFYTPGGTPPPPAETGQVWTGPNFTVKPDQGLYCNNTGGGVSQVSANTLWRNGRLRCRMVLSTTASSASIMFRRRDSQNFIFILCETRDGGGGAVNTIALLKFDTGVLSQVSGNTPLNSLSLVAGGTLEWDISYNGNQIVASVNGVPMFDASDSTFNDATGVGFRIESSTFGAKEDASNPNGSHLTYIWVNGVPVPLNTLKSTTDALQTQINTVQSQVTTNVSDISQLQGLVMMDTKHPPPTVIDTRAPLSIISGNIYNVPQDRQVPYAVPIDNNGMLDVEGMLVEVD